ncbi:Alpha-ketoglutarate-dependent dioxygenase FTO [Liparis tanakae]|uniref:Alpha-ketoglutarate-dependent dioxygenase FTO n=1 Tax=Liparis tanakae TaxID=230148 RepID=A0A4Z2F495_9TELE|nr:Alpha-ketoglutarate-dependent dioxygenase FTO [Liparis tanakae]
MKRSAFESVKMRWTNSRTTETFMEPTGLSSDQSCVQKLRSQKNPKCSDGGRRPLLCNNRRGPVLKRVSHKRRHVVNTARGPRQKLLQELGTQKIPFLGPSDQGYQQLWESSYSGLVLRRSSSLPAELHGRVQAALLTLRGRGCLLRDLVRIRERDVFTVVSRTLLGEPGHTYRYLDTRLFAIPWHSEDAEVKGRACCDPDFRAACRALWELNTFFCSDVPLMEDGDGLMQSGKGKADEGGAAGSKRSDDSKDGEGGDSEARQSEEGDSGSKLSDEWDSEEGCSGSKPRGPWEKSNTAHLARGARGGRRHGLRRASHQIHLRDSVGGALSNVIAADRLIARPGAAEITGAEDPSS